MREPTGAIFSLTVFRELNGEEYTGLVFKTTGKPQPNERAELIPLGFVSRTGHPHASTPAQPFTAESGEWVYQPCTSEEARNYETQADKKALSVVVLDVMPNTGAKITDLDAAEVVTDVLLAQADTPASVLNGALLTLAGVAKAVLGVKDVDEAALLADKLNDALAPTIATVGKAGGTDITPIYGAFQYILEDYILAGVNAANLHRFQPHTQRIARRLLARNEPAAAPRAVPVFH
ncbi:hypothetical protein MRQ47_004434 [Salmonella enterica]|nr:hypothetical protein [Salmonella enterica]